MNRSPSPGRTGLRLALAFALVPLAAPAARAEDFFDWGRDPALPRALDLTAPPPAGGGAGARPGRIRLFRMMPGFLTDPVGLFDDDTTPPDGGPAPAAGDDGPDWIQVNAGSDNPFFDFRRPGDPGGVGYYRLHTQLRLLDSPTTGVALGLQAVTPAGLQGGGLEDGPTFLSPAFSLFHALEDGTAFHGFVGRDLRLNSTWPDQLQRPRGVQYGLAVQRPLLPGPADAAGNVYLFVEALGRYRPNGAAGGAPASWEVLPGMHWQVSDGWWISGGVILPVNGERPVDARLWQITCSFRF